MPSLPSAIGRYEVKQRLGQGGMGAIFLARDPVIDRLVAIKLLHSEIASEDLRRRFSQEARASGALTHPNIVTIHDFGEFDGAPFIVMEYIRGETVAAVIRRAPPLPIVQKLKWIEQVCNAVGYAHGEKIIHRDLKPANLMVDQRGTVKVLDFGIARIIGAGLTKMSMVIGTPGYMSPEQIQGGTIDGRSDIFAAGTVLYELLSYHEAFPGETPHGVMHLVINTQPKSLRELLAGADLSIADVVDKALQKDPAKRFADMAAFEAAIRRARITLQTQRVEPTLLRAASAAGASQKSAPRRRTDPQEIARRRGEQIQLHLNQARRAFDAGDLDTAASECEDVLLLDPASADALELLDRMHRASPVPAKKAPEPKPARVRVPPQVLTPSGDIVIRAPQPAPLNLRPEVSVGEVSLDLSYDVGLNRPAASGKTPPTPVAPGIRRAPRTRWQLWSAVGVLVGAVVAGGVWLFLAPESPLNATSESELAPLLAMPQAPAAPTRSPGSPPSPATPAPAAEANRAAADQPPTQPASTPEPAVADKPASPAPAPESAGSPAADTSATRGPARRGPDANVLWRQAEDAAARGELTEALTQYREVLKLDPTNAVATQRIAQIRAQYLVRRAEDLLTQGDFDLALRTLETAAAADPTNRRVEEVQQKVNQAKAAEAKKKPQA